jgi:hypothetical protein
MNSWIQLVITIAIGVNGSLAAAQNNDADPPAEGANPPATDAADSPPPQAAGDDADDTIFVPTEEIPADEEITFPVNI